MSYRLIDANDLAQTHPEVNDMPCIYADLPNGLDDGYYDFGKIASRDESIHNLIKLLDNRQEFIKILESLVRDMDRNCRDCMFPCFAEMGNCRIITRIEELLGSEVGE